MKSTTSLRSVFKNEEFTLKEKLTIFKRKASKYLLGFNNNKGFLLKLTIYLLLLCIGFVYLYPVLYMFVTSLQSLSDLLNMSVNWIPTTLHTENYSEAFLVLNVRQALIGSIQIALLPTIIQVIISSIVGYGFARFDFPLKRVWFVLMLFSFVIPPQILMMPTYRLFSDLGFTGSLSAFVIPALLGQGLNSTIFILIFYQFFSQTPNSLYEAAEVDGANQIKIFFRIAVPMAIPAFIVAFLFSFVWYWNETYLTSLYLTGSSSELTTTMLQLQQFDVNYAAMYPAVESGPNRINEGIRMAGTVISILPLLLIYFFLQKYFVESVDNTGITGE